MFDVSLHRSLPGTDEVTVMISVDVVESPWTYKRLLLASNPWTQFIFLFSLGLMLHQPCWLVAVAWIAGFEISITIFLGSSLMNSLQVNLNLKTWEILITVESYQCHQLKALASNSETWSTSLQIITPLMTTLLWGHAQRPGMTFTNSQRTNM